MNQIVSEIKLLFKSPNKKEFESSIKISMPEKVDDLEWKCGVEINNIDKIRFAFGIDSLQALISALSLAQAILVNRLKKGWKIYWLDNKRPTTPEEIFGFNFDPSKKNDVI